MRLIDFTFKIIEKNSIMTGAECDELKDKAKEWMKGEALKTSWGKWIVEKQEIWYFRILLAFLFPFVNSIVYEKVNPEMVYSDEDDDGD